MHKFIRVVIQGMIELLYFFPVALLVSAWFILPDRMALWLLSVLMFYVIGYVVTSVLIDKNRLLSIAVQGILTVGLSAILYPIEWSLLMFIAVALFVYTRGAQNAMYEWKELFPVTLQMVALLIYFIASVFFRYAEQLVPYLNAIYVGGLIALALTMIMANYQHLQAETNYGKKTKKISSVVLKHNRLHLFLFFGMILLFAWFDAIRRWIIQLKDAIVDKINEWLAMRSTPEQIQTDSPGALPSAPPFPEGEVEPAMWAVILETIIFYAVYIALIIGALFGLYFAGKRLIVALKRFVAWLRDRWSERGVEQRLANDWGYVDEEQSLELFSKFKDSLSDQWNQWRQRFAREPKWEEFANNRERIRYLYRRWIWRSMKNGYSFKRHLTPNELLEDWNETFRPDTNVTPEHVKELVQIYNASRYGNEEPADERLEKWRNGHANFRT